jgi:hypothetical protein
MQPESVSAAHYEASRLLANDSLVSFKLHPKSFKHVVQLVLEVRLPSELNPPFLLSLSSPSEEVNGFANLSKLNARKITCKSALDGCF